MSQFRIDRGIRELYLGEGGELRQTSPQRSPGDFQANMPAAASPQYKMGVPTYRSGVYVERDNTRPPRPVATSIRVVDPTNPSPPRTHITYKLHHENYTSANPNRESPPPPPYSPPRPCASPPRILQITRSASPSRLVYRVDTSAPPSEPAYHNLSAYQDRNDIHTVVPRYTASYAPTDRGLPPGAPSKIVYSTHLPPQGQGQVSSKPASDTGGSSSPKAAPHSTVSASTPYGAAEVFRNDPRPYQLRPTMDSREAGDSEKPQDVCKEAEVDALTNLLIQNMEVSGDPDFFGMCVKCGRAIMGDNSGCSALDQLFHIECFTCVSCGTCLKGQHFFAMEGKAYCEPCYMDTLEKCSVCSNPITDRILRATGKPYHPDCFTCVVCGKSLDGIQFTVDATNQIHCIEDFHRKFAPRCSVCDDAIMPKSSEEETVRIVAMDRSFHVKCYKCEDCSLQLSSESDGRGCYPLDEHILCKQCNARRIQAMTTRMMTEL